VKGERKFSWRMFVWLSNKTHWIYCSALVWLDNKFNMIKIDYAQATKGYCCLHYFCFSSSTIHPTLLKDEKPSVIFYAPALGSSSSKQDTHTHP
jgi:hypothetical protein